MEGGRRDKKFSMHVVACMLRLLPKNNVSTMASLAIVDTLKSILTFFQFDVPSALTHVWSSKQLV